MNTVRNNNEQYILDFLVFCGMLSRQLQVSSALGLALFGFGESSLERQSTQPAQELPVNLKQKQSHFVTSKSKLPENGKNIVSIQSMRLPIYVI